jgi:thioredoxin reductase
MRNRDLFAADFAPMPYWWEAYRPTAGELADLPRRARAAIVGGGYAGLSAALELAKLGVDAVVLEASKPGFGASTRNGGAVSGGVNIGKGFSGRAAEVAPERTTRLSVIIRRQAVANLTPPAEDLVLVTSHGATPPLRSPRA